ncbi:uncharacterized protein METZ01_LOCUS487980, partial [marine metagenome]
GAPRAARGRHGTDSPAPRAVQPHRAWARETVSGIHPAFARQFRAPRQRGWRPLHAALRTGVWHRYFPRSL